VKATSEIITDQDWLLEEMKQQLKKSSSQREKRLCALAIDRMIRSQLATIKASKLEDLERQLKEIKEQMVEKDGICD